MEFNFDEWKKLYEEDPEEFERRRAEVLEETIQQAPEEQQQRLRGVVWAYDQRAKRRKHPLARAQYAQIEMYNMLYQLNEELHK